MTQKLQKHNSFGKKNILKLECFTSERCSVSEFMFCFLCNIHFYLKNFKREEEGRERYHKKKYDVENTGMSGIYF